MKKVYISIETHKEFNSVALAFEGGRKQGITENVHLSATGLLHLFESFRNSMTLPDTTE